MHYHIILTERCNLRCKYCYEKSMQEFDNGLEKKWDYDLEVPVDSEVSVKKLKSFLKPEDTLIFYGGEPLIKLKEIMEVMDNINCKFDIQTNGVLLDKLPKKYLIKLDKILVSIDGTKSRTDSQRGVRNYDLVLKNLRKIKEEGYGGEIVARMTITEGDVYNQVKHLLDLEIFDSIHWQIDAGFYKFDFNPNKFSQFVEEYNSSISKLIEYWLEELRGGKVLRLYPFLGVFDNIYYNKKSRLPCGSGYANFTITTSGKLSACPIMNSIKNFYCGSLKEGVEREVDIKDPKCDNCLVFDTCGGRCLYWREAKLWPPEGDDLICKTIIHLVEKISGKIGEIREIINSGVLKEEDFEFEKYFGPEIIP